MNGIEKRLFAIDTNVAQRLAAGPSRSVASGRCRQNQMFEKVNSISASLTPAQSEPTGSAAGFDGVAWCYDVLSGLVFGKSLRQAQQFALESLPPDNPCVLIIGGGTGWVLGEVLRRRPESRILYLEASAAMLRRAQATLQQAAPAQANQVTFQLGTEAALAPDATFDALVTFFLLDLFTPQYLQGLLQRLRAAQRPGAPWLVADFVPPQHQWQRVLHHSMYTFFRLTTGISARQLPDWPAALQGLGLKQQTAARFYGGAVIGAMYN